MNPVPFSPIEAVSFGWNAVTKNFSALAAPLIIAVLVFATPSIVLGFARGFVTALLGPHLDPALRSVIAVAGGVLSQIIAIPLQAFIFSGINQFLLRACRGEKPELNVVFSGGRFFLPMLGGQLLYAMGVGLGIVLCLIPGVILSCGWFLYQPFIVDKGLGPVEALTASWRATAGQRGNIFVYLLLSCAVGLAGFAALCIGALIISVPVLMIANMYVYLKLIGEEPRLPA
jgi:uncharacterized membrane protein